MKKYLLLVFLTLFSYLFAKTLNCASGHYALCKKNNINSCICSSALLIGYYLSFGGCIEPKHPQCIGDIQYVNCKCVLV